MKILQICPYDISVPGGVQTHVLELSKALSAKGHEVHVCTPQPRGEVDRSNLWPDVYYIPPSKRYGIWGTSIDILKLSKTSLEKLMTWIIDFQPDLVHFHTIWNPFFQHQLLHALPASMKKVATFHDTPPDRGPGSWLGAPLMKLATRYYFPRLNQIISVSATQAKAMGITNSQNCSFRIIPNGVTDPKVSRETQPDKLESKNSRFTFLFIGRFEGRKGVLDVLEAFRRCREAKIPKSIRLQLVGDGPLLAEIKTYISRYDLREVELMTKVDNAEKSRLLYEADLLVAPSKYGESFGIVLLEAMIHRLKVMGYGNAGYLTIGKRYDEQSFVQPSNLVELTELMMQHVFEPERFDYLIQKGYELAQEYRWEKVSEKILEVYQS